MFLRVAAALTMNSPLETIAGIESDVPDPGPLMRPPVWNCLMRPPLRRSSASKPAVSLVAAIASLTAVSVLRRSTRSDDSACCISLANVRGRLACSIADCLVVSSSWLSAAMICEPVASASTTPPASWIA